jgi:hypothetical protein
MLPDGSLRWTVVRRAEVLILTGFRGHTGLGFEFCAASRWLILTGEGNKSIPPEVIVRMMLLLSNAYVEARMDRPS